MPVIVVANPKGGVGKSTLATNLAGYFTHQGHNVMLGDVDVQQSSRSWLELRPASLPPIQSWEIADGHIGKPPKGTTHINFPSNVLHYREVQVHGSYASRHRDQVHALDMLADDIGGLRSVVSDVVDLDSAPAAFGRIRAGEVLKVVVEP